MEPGRVADLAKVKVHVTHPGRDTDEVLRDIKTNLGALLPTVRKLEVDWPSTSEMMRRLIDHVSDGFTVERRRFVSSAALPQSVVCRAIGDGLVGYSNAERERDDHRLNAFVLGMSRSTAKQLAGLAVTSGKERWSVTNAVPYREWFDACGAPLTLEIVEDRLVTLLQAEKAILDVVLTDRDRYCLRKVGNG